MTSAAPRAQTAARDADDAIFEYVQRVCSPYLPLGSLAAAEYAAKHARFEARSDQRARLTDWLVGLVPTLAPTLARPGRGLRVLSIGCGDGSVDVELARALAATDGSVDYTGVEPHAASGELFRGRLSALPGVRVSVETATFEELRADQPYDVVVAVHSLYYVRDLRRSLVAARDRLAPGGALVVAHAPLGRLNRLVQALAPGREQRFADAVGSELAALGWPARRVTIDGTLDLTRERGQAGEASWRDAVDFTVQAEVPDALLPAVEDALEAIALPDAGERLLLAHPVDAFVATA